MRKAEKDSHINVVEMLPHCMSEQTENQKRCKQVMRVNRWRTRTYRRQTRAHDNPTLIPHSGSDSLKALIEEDGTEENRYSIIFAC